MSVRLICSEDAKVRVKRQGRSLSLRDTQTLVSGFNMKLFTLLLRNYLNFWQRGKFEFLKFDLPYHHSNTDCMNSSFKVTYATSVNCRFYFP